MTEPGAGSDLQGIKTSARRDGDRYVVNGSKTFITNGVLAGLVCLAVKTDPKAAGMKGISLIMIDTKDLPGYHIGQSLQKVGMHEVDTCEMFFDDVRVPASNLLGSAEGKGYSQMLEQLTYERLAVGASAIAMAEHAVSITVKYVKDRRAFGQPLIEFQNTRFKLAECATEAHIASQYPEAKSVAAWLRNGYFALYSPISWCVWVWRYAGSPTPSAGSSTSVFSCTADTAI